MKNILTQTPRIMIVDDTPHNLQLLEAMLRDKGWQVYALPSGEMALRAAVQDRPHLILLDILMPGMDGYQVCARLKADPTLRDIPVIFLSALSEPWDKARAFEVGGVDYITKPFQIHDVEARVQAHLQLRQLRQELADQNVRLEDTVRERTRQLEEAHARLRSLDQAKTDFLQIISHELRTPLNGLFGIADLIFMELPDTPEVADYRRVYSECQQRLLTLIQDALLLTQIEADAGAFPRPATALAGVLAKALADAAPLAEAGGVRLPAAPATACQVIGQPELLAKAMRGLIETAVRFGQRGTAIRLALEPAAERLTIEATGRTIPAENLPHFFEVLGIGKTLTAGGDLGLVPALASSLLRVFGGQVSLENLTPPGIRFSVHLEGCHLPAATSAACVQPG